MRGSSSRKATTVAIDCQRRNVAFSGRSLRWHDPDQVQRSATVPVALSACSRRLPYYCPSVIPTLTRVGKEVNFPRRLECDQPSSVNDCDMIRCQDDVMKPLRTRL